MTCDEDGLVEVVTDGNAYMSVRQKYWCPSVPQYVPSNSKLSWKEINADILAQSKQQLFNPRNLRL